MGEVAQGDHTLFVGEVLEAGVRTEDQTILMRDHNLKLRRIAATADRSNLNWPSTAATEET